MRIILDVNIILSALIKDSAVRKVIIESGFEMFFPEISLHKIRKYEDYILRKSGLKKEDYDKILARLFEYIRLIPNEEILQNWDKAKEIMGHIDQEDVVFAATALSLENSVIWSDDKDFEKQKAIITFKTNDILNYLRFNK